jgi:rhamnose utilization protein RhaD (predicted bifunctional aldolase and dehydrogenase)
MSVRNDVIQFCQSLGRDPLLVQGAGGNVSWKDGKVLWVKASGTCLSDAGVRDIFVPVDLGLLRRSLNVGDFDAIPQVLAGATLRPSIETMLHALMPHRVVVHLHPVDILAWMVRDYSGVSFPFADRESLVPYRKPGAALAQAVANRLKVRPDTNCLLLQNHGLVLGGSTAAEVQHQIQNLLLEMRGAVFQHARPKAADPSILKILSQSHIMLDDPDIQALAIDDLLYARLLNSWALYPDHLVFLGRRAACYESIDEIAAQERILQTMPDLVFVRGAGVYVSPAFSKAQLVQLRCYYDVLVRVPADCKLKTLSESDVDDLLDSEAEKYRLFINNVSRKSARQ